MITNQNLLLCEKKCGGGGDEEDWKLWVFALGCKSQPPTNDNVPFPAL